MKQDTEMERGAEFSDCGKYRYALWRIWDDEKPYVLFIGVNPSTADETEDDPTVTRCINYAKSWKKFGGMYIANLFAYQNKNFEEVKAAGEANVNIIGEKNDERLKELANDADTIIAAWGDHGAYMGRPQQVIDLIPNQMYCLKINDSGQPQHPSRAAANLTPKPYSIPMSQ